MSSAHNAFRVHGMGPCGLKEPECLGTAPQVEGPILCALAAASLMLKPKGIASEFFGFTGEDALGSQIRRGLLHLPLELSHFRRYPGATPRLGLHNAKGAANSEPLSFLLERSQDTPDWPEAAFTQATWVWVDVPPHENWCQKILGVLERARRRNAFTGAWLTFDDPSWAIYAKHQAEWAALCDIVMIEDPEDSINLASTNEYAADRAWVAKLPTCLLLQRQSIRYRSTGGLFGRCHGRMEMEAGWKKSVVIGAFMAHLMHEIFREDDFLRVQVHVDRERLEMQPLHLGMAIEWAALAGKWVSETELGLATENEKQAWLKQVNLRWRERYPERFQIWGGRRETGR